MMILIQSCKKLDFGWWHKWLTFSFQTINCLEKDLSISNCEYSTGIPNDYIHVKTKVGKFLSLGC
jgi:hypothetical protein